MLATLGERAFQAPAPHLWNKLPLQLRTIRSIGTFKNSIKTFFGGEIVPVVVQFYITNPNFNVNHYICIGSHFNISN